MNEKERFEIDDFAILSVAWLPELSSGPARAFGNAAGRVEKARR